ncbi:uncharacterized protein LOC141704026 isoform X1 [Apium graveolens]|uniref:uncharacterized protein LOC141704026 isoform X1 n=1 Tax=Apium graveolens TaxID=4045 RepID=UPI003D795294
MTTQNTAYTIMDASYIYRARLRFIQCRPKPNYSSFCPNSIPIDPYLTRDDPIPNFGYNTTHGTSYYNQLLEQNKQYIQKPATVEKCNELSKKLLYTRLASIPGRNEAMWKEVDYLKQAWKNRKDLKVEDAGTAVVFGLECFAWYCVGEIVGRGFTFTGYYP